MLPLQHLFKGKITLIRPLALMEEKKIERYAVEMGLPFGPVGCPSSGKTKTRRSEGIDRNIGEKESKGEGEYLPLLVKRQVRLYVM